MRRICKMVQQKLGMNYELCLSTDWQGIRPDDWEVLLTLAKDSQVLINEPKKNSQCVTESCTGLGLNRERGLQKVLI